MPGKYDSDIHPTVSFLTDWAVYRSGVAASDANAAAVTATLDLSKSYDAFQNQIWVKANRTAGSGTVTLTLYIENQGSWKAVEAHTQIATQAAVDNLSTTKFTGLLAGIYRITITGISSNTWTLHTAQTVPPSVR